MEHVDPAVIKRSDTRSGCLCKFCKQLDPHFPKRRPIDQLVASNREHTASAHLTEDGYVRHRVLEVSRMAARLPQSAA
ncbi:MAG: hypothetical protein WCC22_19105 [Terriglobales bacterium]